MVLRPNTEIADRVTEALMNDERTSAAAIDVINNQGVVTLSGAVESEKVRQAAQEIARQQPGVITVISELVVI